MNVVQRQIPEWKTDMHNKEHKDKNQTYKVTKAKSLGKMYKIK